MSGEVKSRLKISKHMRYAESIEDCIFLIKKFIYNITTKSNYHEKHSHVVVLYLLIFLNNISFDIALEFGIYSNLDHFDYKEL